MARPTKLTREVLDRIVQAIRAGNHREIAARSAGIGESTLYRWLARGRELERGLHRELVDAVAAAEADAEVHAVAVSRKAIVNGNPAAACRYLERRHPERWGRQHTPDVDYPRPAGDDQLAALLGGGAA